MFRTEASFSNLIHYQLKLKLVIFSLVFASLACALPGLGNSGEPDQDFPPTETILELGPLPPAVVETFPLPNSEISLNSSITFYFNQPMEQKSVEAALRGEPQLSGNFIWIDESTVTFNPASPWLPETAVNFTIGTNALAVNGLSLAVEENFGFKTAGPLRLTQMLPENGTFEVDPTSAIVAAFNRPVVALGADPNSLLPAFSLNPPAEGNGEWLNTSTYIFYPQPGLAGGQVYTVNPDPTLTSLDGVPLEEAVNWSFMTALPKLLSISPEPEAVNLPIDSEFRLVFNQAMSKASVEENFDLSNTSGVSVPGSYLWENNDTVFTFKPDSLLSRSIIYKLTLGGNAQDPSGNTLEEGVQAQFQTVGSLAVIDSNPDPNGGKETYQPLSLIFNAPLDSTNLSNLISFNPSLNFQYNFSENELNIFANFDAETNYQITLSPSIKDKWGDNLGSPFVLPFHTNPLSPQLDFPSFIGGGVLYIDPQNPSLTVQSVNIPNLNLSIAPVGLNEFMILNQTNNYLQRQNYQPENAAVFIIPLSENRNRSQPTSISLSNNGGIDPGLYWISTQADALSSNEAPIPSTFVVASNVHMVYKISPTDILVWAVDRRDGTPISGAVISIFSEEGNLIVGGESNSEGIFRSVIPAQENVFSQSYAVIGNPGEDNFSLATSNWNDGMNAWDFGYSADTSPPRTKIYLYSDRPIYRPGQLVNFRGVLRQAYNGRYQLPDLTKVVIAITDETGAEVNTLSLTLSEFGTIHGTYTIPEGAQPGFYFLRAKDIGLNEGLAIQVAEYRKPDIDLQTSFLEEDILSNQALQVVVEARYFYDAPAGNLDLTWSIFRSPASFRLPGFTTGISNPAWQRSYFGPGFFLGELVESGSGRTDPQGIFEINLASQNVTSLQEYTLEVTIQDKSGFPVSSRSTTRIHPAPTYIGIRPEVYVGQAEVPMGFEVRVVDWEKDAIGESNLEAEFSRVIWQRGESDQLGFPTFIPEYTLIDSAAIITDPQGNALFTFEPSEAGIYQLEVKGGGAVSQALVWVGGPGQSIWPRLALNQIHLTADQDQYKPGDIAQVFIPNPFEGKTQALVTIERGIVLSHQILDIDGSGFTLPVPISEDSAPNIYLAVTLLGTENNAQFAVRHGLINLEVSPQVQTLKVELSSNPQHANPGEMVSFSIRVADSNNQPIRGEFSLSVVDKAVLALAEPNSRNIIDAFYRVQGLGVLTNASMVADPNRLEQSPGGLGGGGGDAGISGVIRQQFEDSAYWNAEIVTGEDGIAQVSIPMPDNLTTWKVEVRGLTADTLVGQTEIEVVTSQDLLIRPVTPRFFVEGDHAQIAALVHNNTGKDLSVDAGLEMNGFTLDDPATAVQNLFVLAGQQTRVEWWGTVDSIDFLDLIFSAKSDDLQDITTPEQGMIPVLQYLAPQTFATAGILEEDGFQREVISLPATIDPSGGELSLTLAPSLTSTLLDGLSVLESNPAQSTEQTVSRFLPNLQLFYALEQFGLAAPTVESSLNNSLKTSIIRLQEDQNIDGGWSWISGMQSDPYISAYALIGLSQAQQLGYRVNEFTIENVIQYLMDYLNKTKGLYIHTWEYDRAAFIYFALTQADIQQLEILIPLIEQRERLNPWGRALMALSITKFSPNDEIASTLISELQTEAVRSATGAHWEETAPGFPNMANTLFNTSMVVYALAQENPGSPLLADAVRYLMAHRDNQGAWHTNYTTAWTILAITETIRGTGELGGEFEYFASWNNSLVIEGSANGTSQLTPTRAVLDIEDFLLDLPNLLEIHREAGPGRLYYSTALKISFPADSAEPQNQGIEIRRTYFPINESCININCLGLTEAQSGSLIKVRLSITLPNDAYYLSVEDHIPAGAEILNPELKTSQQGFGTFSYDPRLPFDSGWGWWLFGDPLIYNERITWLAPFLPAGTYELIYILVLGQPGEYQVIPAQAWQSYFPEVQGTSAGSIFSISP